MRTCKTCLYTSSIGHWEGSASVLFEFLEVFSSFFCVFFFVFQSLKSVFFQFFQDFVDFLPSSLLSFETITCSFLLTRVRELVNNQ